MKEYTEEQKREFKAEYATRFRRKIFVAVILCAMAAPVIFLIEKQDWIATIMPVEIATLIVMSAVTFGLMFSVRNWRCPACNKPLGRTFNPRFCPRCGVQFRDDKNIDSANKK